MSWIKHNKGQFALIVFGSLVFLFLIVSVMGRGLQQPVEFWNRDNYMDSRK